MCIVASNQGVRAAGTLICNPQIDAQIDAGAKAAVLPHDDRPQGGFVQ
jgi:hypothetical protein